MAIRTAYEVVMPYHLHMPSYFLGTFTEYPYYMHTTQRLSLIHIYLADFWTYTGFANATGGHLVMILVGLFFIYLAVAKEFEPMLLIPIGFGMLIGNIPFNMEAGLKVGIYEEGSVLNILYQGVTCLLYTS